MHKAPLSKSLEKKIENKIASIAAVADDIPGVFIIHDLRGYSVKYISPAAEAWLGMSLEEIKKLGDQYLTHFFNEEDSEDYVPKIKGLLERNNPGETISFFQQVRSLNCQEWVWHMSSIKVLLQDEQGKPLLSLTISFPIDPLHHVTAKVSRLLEENNFLRKHLHDYNKLGKREREVLRLMALGKSAPETAEVLFISTATVETHRRNIKQKLSTNSFYELCEYARAFDLI
ncbi:LuxR C-terminal-related transcriptional regulator [uncultured Pontibacter sp.]|uniref:LuxR family transcriptional regulator n=1 Tax=uncultured Pontibacter sp. TaxID=453356 RepID=UPI00262D436E|nr:LuxR C-terminal-related transcriptional regulator [uncultured Pontibacter sp.]